jgi:hypothetical protein
MRMLMILGFIALSACAKSKASDAGDSATSFVPKACSFVATEAGDPRYASGQVDKYACSSSLSNMNCFAYAQGDSSLYMACSLKSALVPQGVPSGCTSIDTSGAHEFLDGALEAASVYDCGVLNDNLRCFYYDSQATSKEEFRCNLM